MLYLFAIYSTTPASMSPARVPIVSPASGVMPIDVSTQRPQSIAARDAPFPRWQETSFSSSGRFPSSSAARRETYRCDVPWKP